MSDNIPVINVVHTKNGVKFFCPHCGKNHHHGKGEGHRVAHCGKHSPYNKTGYILVYPKISSEKVN